MYTPTQIEAIQMFGRKDVKFGLLIKKDGCLSQVYGTYYDGTDNILFIADALSTGSVKAKSKKYEILGHEPHLFPDVARVAEERGWLLDVKWGLLTITFPDRTYTSCKYLTTIPFIEQPEKTLQQIISLFN